MQSQSVKDLLLKCESYLFGWLLTKLYHSLQLVFAAVIGKVGEIRKPS